MYQFIVHFIAQPQIELQQCNSCPSLHKAPGFTPLPCFARVINPRVLSLILLSLVNSDKFPIICIEAVIPSTWSTIFKKLKNF